MWNLLPKMYLCEWSPTWFAQFRLFVLRLAAKLSVCPRLLPQEHLAKKNEKRKPKIQSGQETMSGVRDINSIRAAMIRGNEMAIEVAD